MKHLISLSALIAMIALSSCSFSTPLQKALGQRMSSQAMLGGSFAAPMGPQPSSSFEAFYR